MIIDPRMRDDLLKALSEWIELLRPIVMGSNSTKLEWVYTTLRVLERKVRDWS